MRGVLSFILFLTTILSVSAQNKQIKQITVVVKSIGKALDSVNVDIRTPSFTDKGLTGRDGEFSTSTIFSDSIIIGGKYTIYCYKEGYETMTQSGNIGRGQDDLIFDFNLKPITKPELTLYITGGVFDRLDGSTLKAVNILVQTKKRKINIETGLFGEFLLELSLDELLSKNELYIQLKKENYVDKQLRLNLLDSEHRIYLERRPFTAEPHRRKKVINYIPILGNFYRNENLSGWIYSLGHVPSIITIAYCNISIPSLEEKALQAVSNAGRDNYLARVDSRRNLRKGAYIYSGVLIGASLIHCIIKSNKADEQSQSSINKDFQLTFGSEGIGFTFMF